LIFWLLAYFGYSGKLANENLNELIKLMIVGLCHTSLRGSIPSTAMSLIVAFNLLSYKKSWYILYY